MKQYTLKVKRDKKKGSATITLGGQLNVANIGDINNEVKKAMKDAKSITIAAKDVEDADLTLMQMLKSLEIHCEKKSIDFKSSFEMPETTNLLFERAGLLNLLKKN